jgi:lipopolysaccharide export system protein LptA
MRRFLLLPAALLLAAALPAGAAAQAGTCVLVSQQGPWTAVGDPANRVISADGPLLVRCSGGEELRADSAVIYQNINEVHLFGQVDYQDPTRALTADRAIYSSVTGRLYATGNVVFTDKVKGSTLRGPELEYFRAMEGRPEPSAIAPGRPHLTITPRSEGSGRRREPMEVDADRITTLGERHFTAEGNVVIESKQARSTANQAFWDATSERLELRGNARVDGEKYDLTAEYVESTLKDGEVQNVLARTNARLESERLTSTGPQLRLFFERDLLQRMVSGHAAEGQDANGRSVALAKGFRMEADSLEAISPDQELRQVIAIGTAKGESWDTLPAPRRFAIADSAAADSARGDSARPAPPPPPTRVAAGQLVTEPPEEITEKDVLTADTIIGYFRADSAAADSARGDTLTRRPVQGDTTFLLGRPAGRVAQRDTAGRDTAQAELERLVALGNARSLYRMRDDSARAGLKPHGINYLIGDNIDLTFVDGEVDVAHVRGLKKGVYLDPGQPSERTASEENRPGQGRPGQRPGAQPGQGQPQGQGSRELLPTPGSVRRPAPSTPQPVPPRPEGGAR